MNVTAHQETEKNEETKTSKKGQERRERENRQPILLERCAALCGRSEGSIAKK